MIPQVLNPIFALLDKKKSHLVNIFPVLYGTSQSNLR